MSAVTPWIAGSGVLDLFAGSGALGIEALSRGAAHATFVENDAGALRTLKQNLAALGIGSDDAEVVRQDVFKFLEHAAASQYEVAFADPPYAGGLATRLAEVYRACPFAEVLCIEHARSEPLPPSARLRERRYGDTILSFLSLDDDG